VESAIAQIWQSVLGVARVGRHDNFFELGGHSLLVLKVLAAIKAALGRQIAMVWIFQAPTPAKLAAMMSGYRTEHAWRHLVALKESGNRRPLFCLNGFDGDVNDYLHIARLTDASVPVYGLRVGSTTDDGILHESPDARLEAYERELRSIQPTGPYRLCGYSFGGSEAFNLARRLEDEGEEVALIMLDAYRPSKWLDVLSWIPRTLSTVRANAVVSTARRKLQSMLSRRARRWRTGRDNDVKDALYKRALNREYKSFSGETILFQSQGFEGWAFQLNFDGHNGWKKYLGGPVTLVPVQAGHLALMIEPAVQSVATRLNTILCS
jgi:thioesterase domain-containing protein